MGSMSSPVKSIDHLRFAKMPKKATAGTFVEVSGTQVLLGSKGALYTNVSGLNGSYHMTGAWRWSDSMTECLSRLAITNDSRDNTEGETSKVAGVIVRIHRKKLIALWDSLPWYRQEEAKRYGYMPAGAVIKQRPTAA